MKPLGVRMQESLSIHKQLQSLGVLVIDNNRLQLKVASNAYVQNGDSRVIRLRIDSTTNVIIYFKSNDEQQSGIYLEKP